MIYLLIIIVTLVLSFLITAIFRMDMGIYLRSYCRERNEGIKSVMITFDDGPHPDFTPMILDVLRERGVKAVFFLIGEKAIENPQIVRRIVDEGHLTGIHSLRHTPEFTISSKKLVKRDLVATKNILEELTGVKTKLFRPPYGVTNPSIGGAVKELGLISVGWSLRSFDTISGHDTEKVLKRVEKGMHDGAIILLHDRMPDSAMLTEKILNYLDTTGYEAKLFSRVL
ncbi:MAG: polysaccharide deacetylase family protein [Bacteroidales bacterium]